MLNQADANIQIFITFLLSEFRKVKYFQIHKKSCFLFFGAAFLTIKYIVLFKHQNHQT